MANKQRTIEHIFAGFGGQGILFIGRALCHGALLSDISTSFIPSYGPEMRGGTANCKVVVAEGDVGSPLVENPDVVIAMNRPSLDKFEQTVKPGGKLIVNSSLIEKKVERDDIDVYYVPCNEIAREVGAAKGVSLVALGAYVGTEDFFNVEKLEKGIEVMTGEKRKKFLGGNLNAFRAGRDHTAKS